MARFNSPIERLGSASGMTGWGWVLVSITLLVIATGSWFLFQYVQQKNNKIIKVDSTVSDTQNVLAYVNSIEQHDGRYYATIDRLEWLVGPEADRTARADGVCQGTTTSCLTNGFYLRNSTTTTEMVLLDTRATVYLQTLTLTASSTPTWDESVSFDSWVGLFSDTANRWNQIPFHFSILDDEVKAIREQYVP